MQEYIGKILMAIFILALFILAGLGLYYVDTYEDNYYTKVDNTKVKELLEEKEYEYSLTAYNKGGKKKTFHFKTSRELKEGAYLKLVVRSSGVHKWEEVEEKDIPTRASKKIVDA